MPDRAPLDTSILARRGVPGRGTGTRARRQSGDRAVAFDESPVKRARCTTPWRLIVAGLFFFSAMLGGGSAMAVPEVVEAVPAAIAVGGAGALCAVSAKVVRRPRAVPVVAVGHGIVASPVAPCRFLGHAPPLRGPPVRR